MTYVSPMVRARAIVAGEIQPEKECQRFHAQRMVRLSPTVIADLEAEEAPYHIFRWVAWAATMTDQRRRTDLVIHVRRSIDRPKNGWLGDRQCTAAMAAWDRARNEARRRGGVMPAASEISADVYREVIEATKKRARSTAEEEAVGGEQASAAEPGSVDEVAIEPDEEEDEAVGQPQGRRRVLWLLSEVVREALAAEDIEAAQVTNEVIARLCGGREVGEGRGGRDDE